MYEKRRLKWKNWVVIMSTKMKLDNIWMNFSFHPFQMMGKLLLKMDEEQIVMLLTEVSCLDEIGVVFDTDIGILPESEMTGRGWILWNINVC